MGKRQGKNLAVLQRRVEISKMYLQGFTQTEIGVRLKVGRETVASEIHKIRSEWLSEIVKDYDEIKAKELAKIDHLETVAWEAWERSLKPIETRTKKIQSALMPTEEYKTDPETGEITVIRSREMTAIKEHFEELKREQDGNPAFLDRVSWCIEMRLKIFGILKEEKKEVHTHINFDFDKLIGLGIEDDADDPIEQKIIEVQALPVTQPNPSTNGSSNGNGTHH